VLQEAHKQQVEAQMDPETRARSTKVLLATQIKDQEGAEAITVVLLAVMLAVI